MAKNQASGEIQWSDEEQEQPTPERPMREIQDPPRVGQIPIEEVDRAVKLVAARRRAREAAEREAAEREAAERS